MKELKFRCWDIEHNKMYYADMEEITAGIGQDYGLEDNALGFVNSHIREEKIIMQYTGLKDKKDKEIYEGDIIETDLLDGISRKVKVIWDEENLSFRLHGNFYKKFLNVHDDRENIEIIGNIYETPGIIKNRE